MLEAVKQVANRNEMLDRTAFYLGAGESSCNDIRTGNRIGRSARGIRRLGITRSIWPLDRDN